jgi:phosphate uptake regulator
MIEKPDTIARALELMFISKSIERIADHATNIAEEMVFLSKGQDIRHSHSDQEESWSDDDEAAQSDEADR